MAATRTEQQQVATTPLFEDQIRSYRRNQRRLYNTQQAARRLGRQLTGGVSSRYTFEQQLEPEAQLQLSMQERVSIVPAEVLYHSRRDDAHHRVYVHRSEEAILVADNHQVDRNFIQEEIFRDNRWQGDQVILATMEVDLTRGSQMIYVIPEVMMTIGDFYRNIQISILARGYEAWQNSEANLLITRGMVGRLSNTPNIGFAYEVQGVVALVDYLTSHGVNALPGRRFSTSSLQALNWVINPTQVSIPMQPSEVNSQTMMDGRISLSFSSYAATRLTEQPTFNNKDEEVYETLAVLIETKPGVFTNYDGTVEEHYKLYGEMDDCIKRRPKNRRWDTLGQPSGKFNYYVSYDIPETYLNSELPPPSGWGDEEID
ncbi:hypothetical protein ZIOFF_008461 [Zingiber officinale]|uniref:Uncharacterized protein n=1 Tax=Zingiber officinale TaxID=94328 RepID=A0A8J5HSP6_ZINOF|nr:hypothetical protein ZIOFF_008461 [Zingiber officinale]